MKQCGARARDAAYFQGDRPTAWHFSDLPRCPTRVHYALKIGHRWNGSIKVTFGAVSPQTTPRGGNLDWLG